MIASLLFSLISFVTVGSPNPHTVDEELLGFVEADPDLNWQTAKTKYFYIHFSDETEPVARSLARMADTIFEHHTKQFKSTPRLPIHVVLMNNTDEANGLSTPFPYNTIILNIALPDDGTALDAYDDWLALLFTHELTHTVHIDMALGINRFFRALFGSIVIPNSTQPQWMIEGLAMLNETNLTAAGRGRSSYIDMYFRDAVLNDRFLPIERGMYWNDVYPYGQAAYFYGIRFHQYIAKKYGENRWIDFAHKNARWFFLAPGWFNFKTASIFGKSFDRLWEEWRIEETAAQKKLVSEYRSKFSGSALKMPDGSSVKAVGIGTWDEENQHFYISYSSEKDRKGFLRFSLENGVLIKPKIISKDISPSRPNYKDGMIFFAKLGRVGGFNNYADLYAYDLKEEKVIRVTKGFRIKDIQVFDNSFIAIRSDAYKSSLVRMALPDRATLLTGKWKPIIDISKLEVLYAGEGFDNLAFPSISPDRRSIAFSMHREGFGRDLFLLNLESKELSALTQDTNLDYFPTFSKDGNAIVFVSDRELGGTKAKVFNLYAYHLNSKKTETLTDAWSGIFWPSRIRNQWVVSEYQEDGFVPTQTSLDLNQDAGLELRRVDFVRNDPPILAAAPKTEPDLNKSSYDMGSTLLPKLMIPFWFFSSSDSLVGLSTLARDPLGRHEWQATAFHYITPNRPGGSFGYNYNGFRSFSLGGSAFAQIANQGSILIKPINTTDGIRAGVDKFYERIYGGSIYGAFKIPAYSLTAALSIGALDRSYLLKKPLGLIENSAELNGLLDNFENVPAAYRSISKLSPTEGQQWLLGASLNWKTPIAMDPSGISPFTGNGVSLNASYSPKVLGSDFKTLTTSLKATSYGEVFRDFSLAGNALLGMQWLDRLYQSSFRLGGSFSGVGSTFNLRGLGEGKLRGEGILAGSFEARFPLLKRMPGFGTAPLWLRNLHFGIFTDAGQSFVKNANKDITLYDIFTQRVNEFKINKFSQSVGAELRSDISISYIYPISFRLGYGHVLFLQGQRVIGRKGQDAINEIYFRVGPSF